MITKEIIGKELYVYRNGSLLYKRWLNYGYGIIIQDDTPLGRAQGNFKSHDVFNHVNDNNYDRRENTNDNERVS